jgi:putative tricarboxylic transport membrane protein
MCQTTRGFSIGLECFVMALMIIGMVGEVQSQEKYPSRAVNIICAHSTGAADLAARAPLPYLTKKWGVQVNVVNKPGGNSIPAQIEVYQSPPDGYTLFADGQPFSSLLPLVVKDLPFKVMDRTFIAVLAYGPGVVIVPASSPYNSLQDLVIDAKKDPENLSWASQGGIGGSDYQTRRFFKAIGVDVMKTKPIMTQGGAAGAALVAGGHVRMSFSAFSSAMPHIQAGTVRALCVLWKERDEALPDTPSIAELGYPTVPSIFWTGISGPPKMPVHVVDILDKTLKEMQKDAEYINRLKNVGLRPVYMNATEMKALIVKDMEEASEIYGVRK